MLLNVLQLSYAWDTSICTGDLQPEVYLKKKKRRISNVEFQTDKKPFGVNSKAFLSHWIEITHLGLTPPTGKADPERPFIIEQWVLILRDLPINSEYSTLKELGKHTSA
jgi:hypothetical protein